MEKIKNEDQGRCALEGLCSEYFMNGKTGDCPLQER